MNSLIFIELKFLSSIKLNRFLITFNFCKKYRTNFYLKLKMSPLEKAKKIAAYKAVDEYVKVCK